MTVSSHGFFEGFDVLNHAALFSNLREPKF